MNRHRDDRQEECRGYEREEIPVSDTAVKKWVPGVFCVCHAVVEKLNLGQRLSPGKRLTMRTVYCELFRRYERRANRKFAVFSVRGGAGEIDSASRRMMPVTLEGRW